MASNVIFAIFNGVIGIVSHSAWFGSLSALYSIKHDARFMQQRYMPFTESLNGITNTAVALMVLGIGIQGICSVKKMKTKRIIGR